MHHSAAESNFLHLNRYHSLISGKLKITGEKYHKRSSSGNKLNNKIAIVTGGAQGFGAGIAEALYALNLNVVIADLNEETGNAFASRL